MTGDMDVRGRDLLKRAQEELRLIRMKDCGVVYDTGLRYDLHAYLTAAQSQAESGAVKLGVDGECFSRCDDPNCPYLHTAPALTPAPAKVTEAMVARAITAFISQVRAQDPEWTDDVDEGEILLTAPSGDFFAVEYAIRAALLAAQGAGNGN